MSGRLRVKICGITRVCDALIAAECGVDALGFIFYPKSPRYIEPDRAAEIISFLPPYITTVGVFVNEATHTIESVLNSVSLGVLQFHGEECESDCLSWGLPYLKAFRIFDNMSLEKLAFDYPKARGFLLDTYKKGIHGGTGEVFNWDIAAGYTDKPIVLAGGIKASNILEAYAKCKPYGIDLNSGVEKSPGIKDEQKIRKIMDVIGEIR